MTWLYEDESTALTESVLDALAAGAEALAPSLWPWEVANVLLVGERRGRNTAAQSAAFLEVLEALPITVVPLPAGRVGSNVQSLARDHGLSVYDAGYLELATRHALSLVTLDRRLGAAATACGLPAFAPGH